MPRRAKRQIPVVSVSGSPYELGFKHGQQAREAIRRNCDFYLEAWRFFSGVGREQVMEAARKFIPFIKGLGPDLVEELRGVAEGSGISFEEIVALNSRWELNYAYMLGSSANAMSEGCTAFALMPQATQNKHMLVGQNWDYKPGLEDSCIILKIKQEKKPEILMHTEAGIIGHKGFNSAGIGLCMNFIRCEKDVFRPGLPVWIKARGILNSNSLIEALKVLTSFDGPNSANMVIAHRDGEAIDAECVPDDTHFVFPTEGILTHSNHFLSPSFRGKDVGKCVLPDTLIRNRRVARLFQGKRGRISLSSIKGALRDHFGYPASICRHRDETVHPNEQWETLISMIIDLEEGKMFYISGPPCSYPYATIAINRKR